MTHGRRRWMALFALVLAWQGWRLLAMPHGTPSTWAWDAVAVSAAGGGLRQELLMGADGFDGVEVRVLAPEEARTHGAARLTGTILVSLDEVQVDRTVPLQRLGIPADTVRPGRWHIPFREIRASRGRLYEVTIRHVGAGDGGALRLGARPDDAHPPGRFHVDGTEQWGDLVFTTTARRATLPYWKDEVLAPWPAWLRSWPMVAVALVLVNVLLAAACRAVVDSATSSAAAAATDRAPAGLPDGPTASASRGTPGGRAARVAVAAIVVVGLAAAAWPTPPLRDVRLMDHLSKAAIETTAPALHAGVAVQPLAFEGRAVQAIVALPPSRIAWEVRLPTGALLEGAVAMRPDVWDRPSDGARLRVAVVDAAGREIELARFTLAPFLVWEHRGLHPFRVSLDPWARQQVTLVFETDPEQWGNAVNDVPVWVAPRIVWPRGPAWGDAALATHPDAGRR